MLNLRFGIGLVVFLILITSFFWWNKNDSSKNSIHESVVIDQTYQISVNYIDLRLKTDHLLREARNYENYQMWQEEMSSVIIAWQALEESATKLNAEADHLSRSESNLGLIPNAQAAETYELTAIFDAAPAGQKIKTLAKHLGTDAKTAYKMLQMEQAQVEADAWNEAGDTFKRLETQATVLKDVCKVTTYVGTIVATGGASAVAAGSTLSQAAVVVSGADLVLEVTSDAAQIGLGDNNKISSVINTTRVVTEPLSSVLTITSIPENLASGFDKFNAVIVGLEQFNSAAQDGKIAGVKLPVYQPKNTNDKSKVVITSLSPEDVSDWIEKNGGTETNPDNIPSIITQAVMVGEQMADSTIASKDENVTERNEEENIADNKSLSSCSVVGIWEGTMKWTSGANDPESEQLVVYDFKDNGTVSSNDDLLGTYTCVDPKTVHIYEPEVVDDGYHEFSLSGNTLTFIKIAGPDEEGTWSEVYAGEDFFGGKYLTLTMTRQ